MINKSQITINLPYAWMAKAIEEMQEKGIWTTQESIDAAFKDAIWDTLKKYQDLVEMRSEVFDNRLYESWAEEKASRLGDISIWVCSIKSKLVKGKKAFQGHWEQIWHYRHKYMTYQEWIDYMMTNWANWSCEHSTPMSFGWTEEQMKEYFTEEEFNREKMMPCTCKMCKDGETYSF